MKLQWFAVFFLATSCLRKFIHYLVKPYYIYDSFWVCVEHEREKLELYLEFLKSINLPSPLHLPLSSVILHRLACPQALATEPSRAVSDFIALILIQAWQLIDYEWFKQHTDHGQAENSKHAKLRACNARGPQRGHSFCGTSHLLMRTPGVITGLDMGFI